jgi:VanZ family protein
VSDRGDAVWPGRLTYLAAAAAAMAFAAYGSLVPFTFEPIGWEAAIARLTRARARGLVVVSRTDLAANVLLFVPIGYLLLAWLRTDRVRRAGHLITAAGVAVVCAVYSVAIESAQAFVPARLPSMTDVAAQWAGGLAGVLLWLAAGPAATRWLRAVAPRRSRPMPLQALLALYTGGFVLAQWLPLDLTVDLGVLAEKVREGRIHLRPFAYDYPSLGARVWDVVVTLLLWVPVGAGAALAAANRRPPWPASAAAAAGAALVGVVELGQVFVMSRVADATDVITGLAGVAVGVALARAPVRPDATATRSAAARRST